MRKMGSLAVEREKTTPALPPRRAEYCQKDFDLEFATYKSPFTGIPVTLQNLPF